MTPAVLQKPVVCFSTLTAVTACEISCRLNSSSFSSLALFASGSSSFLGISGVRITQRWNWNAMQTHSLNSALHDISFSLFQVQVPSSVQRYGHNDQWMSQDESYLCPNTSALVFCSFLRTTSFRGNCSFSSCSGTRQRVASTRGRSSAACNQDSMGGRGLFGFRARCCRHCRSRGMREAA